MITLNFIRLVGCRLPVELRFLSGEVPYLHAPSQRVLGDIYQVGGYQAVVSERVGMGSVEACRRADIVTCQRIAFYYHVYLFGIAGLAFCCRSSCCLGASIRRYVPDAMSVVEEI